MSIRKRTWTTRRGERKEAWIVDYTDARGVRCMKTFPLGRKKEANLFSATTAVEIRDGTHVADSASVTVKEAGDQWIATAEADGLERTTVNQYRQHLAHIEPLIGRMKLSQLNAPAVRRFEETLRAEGHSPTMVKYIVRSLGALLADAQESGLVVRNAVRELSGKRRHKKSQNNARAQRGGKLRVGVDIPTKDEIRAIVNAAEGRWRPLLITAIFTGLRASELRGLRWDDVDFEAGVIHVTQRADRFNKIGPPKTAAGQRSLPMGNLVRNTLTAWQKECPKGKLRLTFPNGKGNVEFHVNIIERGLRPTLIRAGITVPALDEAGEPLHGADGRPLVEAKYTGMHALRHFYASWCASMGLSMKVVQVRMGHSNIAVTMDTYTHLFPDSEDPAKLAEAENALLGMNATQGAA